MQRRCVLTTKWKVFFFEFPDTPSVQRPGKHILKKKICLDLHTSIFLLKVKPWIHLWCVCVFCFCFFNFEIGQSRKVWYNTKNGALSKFQSNRLESRKRHFYGRIIEFGRTWVCWIKSFKLFPLAFPILTLNCSKKLLLFCCFSYAELALNLCCRMFFFFFLFLWANLEESMAHIPGAQYNYFVYLVLTNPYLKHEVCNHLESAQRADERNNSKRTPVTWRTHWIEETTLKYDVLKYKVQRSTTTDVVWKKSLR